MSKVNTDKLITAALNNRLTVNEFQKLLVNHYNFNVLKVIELVNEYESKLNK